MSLRCAIGLPLASVLLVASPVAQAQTTQEQLRALLDDSGPEEVAHIRSACALGSEPGILAKITAAGVKEEPTVGAWCITVLTRAGRSGTLGYVRDPNSDTLTPALAFDNGFVRGYLANEPVPANAPSMTTLLPVADRCFSQAEANLRLCTAAAQVFGARAARGETVVGP